MKKIKSLGSMKRSRTPRKLPEQTHQENCSTHDDNYTDTHMEEDKEEDMGQHADEYYEGLVFIQKDLLFNLQEEAGIPPSCMLLDSQSTLDKFCSPKMLQNIHEAK